MFIMHRIKFTSNSKRVHYRCCLCGICANSFLWRAVKIWLRKLLLSNGFALQNVPETRTNYYYWFDTKKYWLLFIFSSPNLFFFLFILKRANRLLLNEEQWPNEIYFLVFLLLWIIIKLQKKTALNQWNWRFPNEFDENGRYIENVQLIFHAKRISVCLLHIVQNKDLCTVYL